MHMARMILLPEKCQVEKDTVVQNVMSFGA